MNETMTIEMARVLLATFGEAFDALIELKEKAICNLQFDIRHKVDRLQIVERDLRSAEDAASSKRRALENERKLLAEAEKRLDQLKDEVAVLCRAKCLPSAVNKQGEEPTQ